MQDFNEATRVQIPGLVHLTRIGYTYFGKISEEDARTIYDPDLNDMYVTLVCYSSESHNDENNENITVQFLYLHDDCPYGWDTLAKCGAKYMVIERPKK